MLKLLQLVNFRSYEEWRRDFSDGVTVLVGANGSGKTNVLEAVNLLATGDSFRASRIEEMVNWEEEVGHVVGKVERDDGTDELRVQVTRGMVQGKKVAKRRYFVNGVPRQKRVFVGNLPSVVFLPEDLVLVGGSPSGRRRFLDQVLIQTDAEYRRSLLSYEKGLRRRNRILTQIREGEASRDTLTFWNNLLVKEGQVLNRKRREWVDYCNSRVVFEFLGNGDGGMRELLVDYLPSVISEGRLEEYASREVAAGHTLIGPHKDDFLIMSNDHPPAALREALRAGETRNNQGRDLAIYGSRGEQRMGVLWLKLNQMGYMTQELGARPMLLLDDIFSELDQEHEQEVWAWCKGQQTIVTATEVDGKFAGAEVVKIGFRVQGVGVRI